MSASGLHELACILQEACLPVVDHISLLDNPDKAWSRISDRDGPRHFAIVSGRGRRSDLG